MCSCNWKLSGIEQSERIIVAYFTTRLRCHKTHRVSLMYVTILYLFYVTVIIRSNTEFHKVNTKLNGVSCCNLMKLVILVLSLQVASTCTHRRVGMYVYYHKFDLSTHMSDYGFTHISHRIDYFLFYLFIAYFTTTIIWYCVRKILQNIEM